MTQLSERGKAFEDKFALDEETNFRVDARQSKLIAFDLSSRFDYDDDQKSALVAELVNIFGEIKLRQRVAELFVEKNIAMDTQAIDNLLLEHRTEAIKQITTS